jgi:sarcosine oxidase subunit alpha
LISKQAGVSVPAIVDVRPDPDPALVARAKELGIEVLAGQAVLDTSGALRSQVDEGRQGRRAGRRARYRSRCADHVCGLDALGAHVFAIARQGGLGRSETQRFLPGRNVQDCAASVPAMALTIWTMHCRRGKGRS